MSPFIIYWPDTRCASPGAILFIYLFIYFFTPITFQFLIGFPDQKKTQQLGPKYSILGSTFSLGLG